MTLENPWSDRVYALIRAFAADRVPPTPSAQAMRAWLEGPGRLQLGSAVAPQVDRVWLRAICNGRWSVVTSA